MESIKPIEIGRPGIWQGRTKISYDFRDQTRGSSTGEPASGAPATSIALPKKESRKDTAQAGPYRVIPWGPGNRFPNELIRIFENNFIPGLIDFKKSMLYGLGPRLIDISTGQTASPDRFPEERAWLDSWDYSDYLLHQVTDYATCENTFGQVRRSRDRSRYVDILHIDATECRIQALEDKQKEPSAIVVGDYTESASTFTRYPLWRPSEEVRTHQPAAPISMYHFKNPTFGFRYYNYPVYIGAVNSWMNVANQIPEVHKAALRNMLMAVYHITIPMHQLTELAREKKWGPGDMEKFIETKLDEIDRMLTGAANAGKTFYTFSVPGPGGKEERWEINLIDSQMKEISESYLKLFNDSNQAITSAMQVPPSLACIQLGDKMSSGSEVLNSYNFYVKTRTPMARRIILSPINYVLRINFPGTQAAVAFEDISLVGQAENHTGLADPSARINL